MRVFLAVAATVAAVAALTLGSAPVGAAPLTKQHCQIVKARKELKNGVTTVQRARAILLANHCNARNFLIHVVCAPLQDFGKVVNSYLARNGQLIIEVGKRPDSADCKKLPPGNTLADPLSQFNGQWQANFQGTATVAGVERPLQAQFTFTVEEGAISGDATGEIDSKTLQATLKSDFGIGADCTAPVVFKTGGTMASTTSDTATCTLGSNSATGTITANKVG
jgi:hypothetical protein